MTEDPSRLCSKSQRPPNIGRRLLRENLREAKRRLGQVLAPRCIAQLKALTRDFGFSLVAGALQVIDGNWYVTHTGLLRLARRRKCKGIHVETVDSLCDSTTNRFVMKATVYRSNGSAGFVGYGDADPCNVSALVCHLNSFARRGEEVVA